MRAVTVEPGQAGTLTVADVPDPTPADGEVLVDGIAVGVCGTDKEIVAGDYGWAPPDSSFLVLGHESLGRVRKAPRTRGAKERERTSKFSDGDLIVGVV